MIRDIKACIFDLDGTLIEFPLEFFLKEAQRIFLEITGTYFSHEYLYSKFASFELFSILESRQEPNKIDLFWKLFDAEKSPKPQIVPGVLTFLKKIDQQGVDSFIVTSRFPDKSNIDQELKSIGIRHYFKDIIKRDNATNKNWFGKTQGIKDLLFKYNLQPNEVIFVGDTPSDMSEAKEASLPYRFAVLTGHINKEVFEYRDKDVIVISSLNDLYEEYY
jgi:phosphoglycolate phosphatase-like HAD superfamily hydrolase